MSIELQPIGTIVNLKNVNNYNFMIIGYLPTNENNESKDYVGVRYPMGAVNNKVFFYFNHSDITDVIFTGYINNEFDVFKHIFDEKPLR